jgi:GH25 family lysozyme M1 (1,4-beta-N-acetylmuramidase)
VPVSIAGESAVARRLGIERAADEALPHSPTTLAQLADPIGRGRQGGHSTTTPVPGIDVAAFQHPNGAVINWADVAAAGYKFVAVKATEGDYYVNPWAASDVAVAREVGMYATPYAFAIPNVSSGAEQAWFLVHYSGYATGSQMLPPLLDIEYDPYASTDGTNMCYGLSPSQMTSWIAAFVSTARSLTGQYPIIYSTAGWWETCTGDSTAFGADPMWIAAYGFTSPPMPAGWSAWTFWQNTSAGTVPGVETPGGTDLDVFDTGLPGLIDPGSQLADFGTKVAVLVPALAAFARQPLNYKATGLPPGLAINDAGMISGVIGGTTAPDQAAKPVTYKVTVTAANIAGTVGSVSFSWQVGTSVRVP